MFTVTILLSLWSIESTQLFLVFEWVFVSCFGYSQLFLAPNSLFVFSLSVCFSWLLAFAGPISGVCSGPELGRLLVLMLEHCSDMGFDLGLGSGLLFLSKFRIADLGQCLMFPWVFAHWILSRLFVGLYCYLGLFPELKLNFGESHLPLPRPPLPSPSLPYALSLVSLFLGIPG